MAAGSTREQADPIVLPLLVLALVVGSGLPALAALPPQYQRQREIEAVLAAAVDALGVRSPVERIELIEPDVWLVGGGTCRVTVRIVDAPAPHAGGWAGPREFSTVVEPPVCD